MTNITSQGTTTPAAVTRGQFYAELTGTCSPNPRALVVRLQSEITSGQWVTQTVLGLLDRKDVSSRVVDLPTGNYRYETFHPDPNATINVDANIS